MSWSPLQNPIISMHLTEAAAVIFLCLGLLTSTRLALADGSVGCLFTKSLCKPETEWCFDDYAFGRCLSRFEDDNDLDFYQYDLKENSLLILRQELERLMNLGYGWSHFYTQCVLKALLYALRYENEYNANSCRVFYEELRKPSFTFFGNTLENVDPKNVGQVQFTPSVVDPHAEYADEIYIPVIGRNNFVDDSILSVDGESQANENYINDLRKALLLTAQMNKNKRSKNKNRFEITKPDELEDEISQNYAAYLNEIANEELSNDWPYTDYLSPFQTNFKIMEKYKFPEQTQSELDLKQYDKDTGISILEDIIADDKNILKSFSRNYNTPEKFRKGHETRDEVVYPKINQIIDLKNPSSYFYPEERQFAYDIYGAESDELSKNSENNNEIYTEGGVVYLKNDVKSELNDPFELEDLLETYNTLGFKRPERLDVKKPGPSFSTNNYAFQKTKGKDQDKEEPKTVVKNTSKSIFKSDLQKSGVLTHPEKKKVGSPMESPSLRRQTTTVLPLKEKIKIDNEGGYAYITLKNKINTWQEGSRIVRKIEELLKLNPNTFSNVKVEQNELRFKVAPNRLNLNASEVTGRIENNKDFIQRAIGVGVLSTGVGDQSKMHTSMSLLGKNDKVQLWILSFLLCAVIAAIAIVVAVLFVIKRHSHHKDKLKNLSQLDTEASKDYQDLCRARMSTKSSQEKPEGTSGHRVTNLAKESEGSNHHSPSSRSSTSSWSEEPALINMDISTGHMVLSYMEDHLKNKDRLEQEWVALCAYEAEPCATIIAVKEENSKKNRYNDVLPYDHSRVILNELSNLSGSDYINASTITDHDPRNPAYIATQGPLPHTAADFWQMVWEQGSVVMVMLTRLTENGTVMCHRYWPDEGSELYHIYEVHLVSEHIWCDDYLVRSFYLKNLKTGETRTVTQFHFLSWPENGIPLSTKALLEFRRKVNKSYRGRSCPIVVHCSDGVGRTGTYCLIDMVLNRMGKGAKEIDIAATLEHIRDQRPLMVRTKQQFEFVLMAVAEEVHAILKALPTNPNHSPPPVLKEKD